ncbi:zinc ABC transporter substrate-binding protein [Ahrensia marina]|uniref:metal ABC transporter solute-binding protein, Zn/Mn family n=1 Tax=Ahrensia marina TaxID=1514904 RepID=UPI0035CF34EB
MRSSIVALTLLSTTSLASADSLDVVASFSILADMTRVVGGDHVSVTSLVGPGEDAHVYQPIPTDVVAVTGADLVITNGLGFEGFLERLIEASDSQATIVTASTGIDVIEVGEDDHHDHDDHDDHAHAHDDDHNHDHAHDDHDDHGHDDHAHDDHGHDDHDHDHAHDDDHDHDHGHDDEHAHDDHGHEDHDHHDHAHHDHDHGPNDPHAWQSLDAAQIYVANIADGLCEALPGHCDEFTANAQAYASELEALEANWEAALADVAVDGRTIITSHDAFGYLARDFDLTILAAQGMSTESEASAADVAAIIDQILETGARALFVENISDPRLIEQIADETGLTVTGTLYSDALSVEGEASTYLGMMASNLRAISEALQATN